MCGPGEDKWGPDSAGSPGPDQHAGGQHRVPGGGALDLPMLPEGFLWCGV